MNLEVAVARIEEKLDSRDKLILQYMQDQERRWQAQLAHNTNFYHVRDLVHEKIANTKGAWFTVGIFGTLTAGVATIVSAIVSWFATR
jgi:hypothetical protein